MDDTVRRRRLRIIFGTLVGLPIIGVLIFFFAPATRFSPEALHNSVAREVGRAMYGETGCNRHVKGGWSCSLYDLSGSGFEDYRVEMDGSRCWHGVHRASGGKGDIPANLHGCLKVRDQIRLWDRL